jgi:hypothetical protein
MHVARAWRFVSDSPCHSFRVRTSVLLYCETDEKEGVLANNVFITAMGLEGQDEGDDGDSLHGEEEEPSFDS